MNLNNCHNRVIGRGLNRYLGLSHLLILLLLTGLILPLATGCQPLAPEDRQLTTVPTSRQEAAPLVLSDKEVLTQEEANTLAKKLDQPLETYDLLRPGGAVDLSTLTPSHILRVVDGDTFIIEWEDQPTRLRLIGIDAPESYSHHDPDKQTQEGESVSRLVTAWLEDRDIYLQFDKDPYDPYDRLLAYVWLDAHQMVNEILVREGLAFQRRYPPNTHFNDYFEILENKARWESRGIWRIG